MPRMPSDMAEQLQNAVLALKSVEEGTYSLLSSLPSSLLARLLTHSVTLSLARSLAHSHQI